MIEGQKRKKSKKVSVVLLWSLKQALSDLVLAEMGLVRLNFCVAFLAHKVFYATLRFFSPFILCTIVKLKLHLFT